MVFRVAFILALVLGGNSAQADVLRMVCQTAQKVDMTLVFDTESRSLQATVDNIKSTYIVGPVQTDQRGTLVGGRVSSYGHDYVALFGEQGWIHNLYANGSKLEYRCKLM
jgi:hypothetical protein